MPPNTIIFLLGLAVGTGLLVVGLLLGYWLGRRAPTSDAVDRQQFLTFLQNLTRWTNEFAGDVGKYQTQLNSIDEQVRNNSSPPREEMLEILSQIMRANGQLQMRLETAEEKLALQTDQISNYLTEARTDGLTGLFNRRAFDKATDTLFTDWNKQGQSFSLGLIDIDHFKSINDTYGHPAGDAVLRHISGMLQSEMQNAVCVARYGGEEFAVLTRLPADETARAIDHLRNHVSQIQVKHDDQTITVTLSGGASQIAADDTIGHLVRRADEALYAAKLDGRNRVYLHDGTLCHLIGHGQPTAQEAAATPAAALESPEDLARQRQAEATMARIHQRLQRIVEEESRRVVGR